MKLNIAFFLLSASLQAAAAFPKLRQNRDLQVTCPQTIDDLDFPNIVLCSDGYIRMAVDATLEGTGCTRNGVLMQLGGSEDLSLAYANLRTTCRSTIEPCSQAEDLEATFPEIVNCGQNTIKQTIIELMPDECTRSFDTEGVALAPDEYTVWNDNNEATSNARDYWMDTCESAITTCITDFAAFDAGFKTIERCEFTNILQHIEDNQKEGCARAPNQDAPLLARKYWQEAHPGEEAPIFVWGGKVPERNAALYLKDRCLFKIEPCVPNPDLDFTDALLCDHGRVEDTIRESQTLCDRSAREDARVIVRDLTDNTALLPWHVKDPLADSASKHLIGLCHDEVKSCVGTYDELNFKDIAFCHDNTIKQEITANQREGCTRHVNHDATMLVREKEIADNGDAPIYVWRDNNEDTPDAAEYLNADCEASIEACSQVDDLDFANIRKCDHNTIKAEIRAKQEGCTSDRDETHDAVLMTGAEDWTGAIASLMATCEEKITPCVSLESLDFSNVNSCGNRQLLGVIDSAREAMGDACASYEIRPSHEEAILITDTEIWNDKDDSTLDAQDVLYNTCMAKVESCTFGNGESLEVDGCDWVSFQKAVKQAIRGDETCNRDVTFELHALNRSLTDATNQGTQDWIDEQCAIAWSGFETSTFAEVDPEFTDDFMVEYVDGETHLNRETGNFQGNCVYGRNDEIGSNIAEFKMEKAHETKMQGFGHLEQCTGRAIMCCFGRDRQFGDNNGNCAIESKGGCEDADPADNSNLCKTDTQSYPNNDAPENDIHCHGLAWGDDENDFSRQLIFNNFFFVSLYDHMYSRGYVERTIRREDDAADFGMCDCLEDMPPVSRSDCTEVAVNPFTLSRSSDGTVVTASRPDRLDVEFNACRGVGRSNDLSAHIKKLANEERIEKSYEDIAWKTLVGYANPNDNDNEAACTAIL